MAEKRLAMLVDLKRCIGCHTCAMACKIGNNLPEKIWWNQVLTAGGQGMDMPQGTFPNLKLQYLTLACQQCTEPACVQVCPVEATYKRQDGVVMQDYERCVGCGQCIAACPYQNVRHLNDTVPQYTLDFPIGDANVPAQRKDTVSKCCFCYHRLDDQKTPNCIECCPARARYFGDLSDPNSVVSCMLKQRDHKQLLAECGTKPSIYFLI